MECAGRRLDVVANRPSITLNAASVVWTDLMEEVLLVEFDHLSLDEVLQVLEVLVLLAVLRSAARGVEFLARSSVGGRTLPLPSVRPSLALAWGLAGGNVWHVSEPPELIEAALVFLVVVPQLVLGLIANAAHAVVV